MAKIEIVMDVIVHATEDISKFFESFKEIFGLDEESFSISHVTGHFENPITILRVKITKKCASQFLEKFLKLLSQEQIREIIREIDERTEHSTFHLRFDKQGFIQGKIAFNEKESIRLKIHTPIYNKKDTTKIFSEIFTQFN